MTLSVTSFIVSLVLFRRLGKLARINNYTQLEKNFRVIFFATILLLVLESSLRIEFITKWIWHFVLIATIFFSLKQDKNFIPRMLIWAFVPVIVINAAADLIEVINPIYFEKWDNYINNAVGLSFIWMAAILFSQNRQAKQMEKERIKKMQEDELNRAIAVRKVELEVLVAERTAELTKQKEELQHALTDLRTTQNQLVQSEKMASLGELTAGIAHEIQNPLNFVNNFSELNGELIEELQLEKQKPLLERDEELEKQLLLDIAQNLEKINHHGKRADAIVKGMLQHSRSTSSVKEPTDINALADEYLRLSYHGLRAKDKSFNATIKTEFDENIGKINIISQDIGRVILNLLTNAFYAVAEKKKQHDTEHSMNVGAANKTYEPTVTVLTKKIDTFLEISVQDNGSGIPQKVLEKIFQPFFTTKPTGKGTGLGLSLSYDIVTKGHNGQLLVNTKEGSGTTFTIKLPY